MGKKTDWKSLGQLVSVLVSLFTLVRDTLVKAGAGIEILAWVTGEGKKQFTEEFLQPLATRFLATQRWNKISANTVMVNLGASPILPFDGAKVEKHEGVGWVKVQKRKDGLYVAGRKVTLYLSEGQQNGKWLKGHELRDELTGKPVLNANILDALYENIHLIPEDWKRDENGNIRYIYFWGTRFASRVGSECVRYLYFSGGTCCRFYDWLGNDWDSSNPAAVLAGPSV